MSAAVCRIKAHRSLMSSSDAFLCARSATCFSFDCALGMLCARTFLQQASLVPCCNAEDLGKKLAALRREDQTSTREGTWLSKAFSSTGTATGAALMLPTTILIDEDPRCVVRPIDTKDLNRFLRNGKAFLLAEKPAGKVTHRAATEAEQIRWREAFALHK